MEQRRFQAEGKDYAGLRRGWCVGGEEFRQELLAQAKVRVGPNHFGSERRESAEERARRLIGEALKECGYSKEMTNWTRFGCDAVRQLRAITNANKAWTTLDYCGRGSPSEVRRYNKGQVETSMCEYDLV
jgi:hypothetical protein